ncbi:type IV secretion protein Rhs [Lentzea sp. NBRC 105346]|uniref:RHS repeat-associated core domain-containing protein n=1 Tax=Lentzea sp. NBRC 105346 TaxID=3032205 RepID=UPI0024A32450|nr:RHS repeat-associated core domain-containing protein [Lentzea sp. NBRC 105346]GLZ31963.1 type IV secretion protein Rhs [Lentzea sp. NBRC 105346]
MTNPLLAEKKDSTTWHTGINLIDDAAGVYDAVESGSWIEGGIAALGTGMDLLTIAMNPVGTLISYGLNFLIEHVKPLKDALDLLAGDVDQITAYSQTWANIGKAVGEAAKNLTDAASRDTANWAGAAADTYRQHVEGKVNGLSTAVTCANAISTVVKVVGMITGVVRGLVRDMVTQAVGDFIQDALEEIFTLGLGTPLVVAQVVEQVAAWTEKIGATIKKLINSVEKLRPIMSKLEEIWHGVQKVMSELHGGGGEPHVPHGETGGGMHVSSAEPHTGHVAGGETHVSSVGGETHVSKAPETHGTSTPHEGGTTHTSGDGSAPHGGEPHGTTGESGGTRSSGADDSISSHNENPSANSKPNEGTPAVGDPVDVSTGVMLTTATDVDLPGALPLVIARTHRSTHRLGRWFGRSWASTLDQKVEVEADAVHFAAADGMLLKFPVPADSGFVLPVEGAPLRLARTADGYTVTDRKQGRTFHFAGTESRLPITAITDRNGNRIDVDYDAAGTITGIRHSGGYHLRVDTNDGLITGIALRRADGPDVPLIGYHYHDRNLAEVANSSGSQMRYEYDADGRIVRWEDRNGVWYRFTYDREGRCVKGDGKDGFLSYTFEYANLVTKSTNSLGYTTTYHLNERLQVVREVDPLGNAVTSEWDSHHRLRSRTDALGRTVRCEYDADGNLAVFTRADGEVLRTEYNELGLPTTVVEPDGAVWTQEYDERGNRTSVTDPTGARTGYTFDDRGNLATITDALGQTSTLRHDAAGLLQASTDPAGATTTYERDVLGRVSVVTDPAGGVTRLAWTVEGKPLSRTLPDGSTERWHYDGEGNAVRRTDALGRDSMTEFGCFDLPLVEIAADGSRTEFGYNTELRPTSVTNPQGLVWRYEYDACGRLVRETDFDGRVQNYERDAAGQLVARTNGAGETARYRYDPMGNVIEEITDGVRTTFAYDPLGRVLRATNPDADTVFVRDVLGRVVEETTNGMTVASRYDVIGRRVGRTTPSGVDSVWEYDPANRPVAVHTAGRTVRFRHDVAGREVERDLGAATLVQTWDGNHRLRTQAVSGHGQGGLLLRRSYRYRSDGYLEGVVDQLTGPRDYDLDARGRVTGVRGGPESQQYQYDPAGNVVHAAWPTAAVESAAGPRVYEGTLLRRAGSVHYQHDRQGRVVLRRQTRLSRKADVWHYTWSSDDRLLAVTTPDGTRWRYRYDALGRRFAKQRLAADGVTVAEETIFHWDDKNLVEQSHGGGATTWEYEPGTFRPVSQLDRDGVDARFYAIVTDLVGTATELVDAAGEVAWRGQESLWGVRADSGVGCPLRFPGQYHDPESRLNYNYHRYYDPETGRYQSNDPLGLEGGPNPSAYVPNPTAWMDPLGLEKCPLGQYADTLRGENQAATPRVAAEYTSPSGKKYYAHSSEGVPLPDHLKAEMEKIAPVGGRHGSCAEVNAISKAVAAEGVEAMQNGSVRAVRVKPVNSPTTMHGTSLAPCDTFCQPLLRALGITW